MGMTSYKRGIIAGMELAMRICRSRAVQYDEDHLSPNYRRAFGGLREQEARTCVAAIRFCQVEIGAGRMELPQFTLEEEDEINRIR